MASYRVFKAFLKPPELDESVVERDASTPHSSQFSLRLSSASSREPRVTPGRDRPDGFPSLQREPRESKRAEEGRKSKTTPSADAVPDAASVQAPTEEDSLDLQSLFSEQAVVPPVPTSPSAPRVVYQTVANVPRGFPALNQLKKVAHIEASPASGAADAVAAAGCVEPRTPVAQEKPQAEEGVFGDTLLPRDYYGDELQVGDFVKAVKSGHEGTVVALRGGDAVVVIDNKWFEVNGVHIVKVKTEKKPPMPLESKAIKLQTTDDLHSHRPRPKELPANPPGMPRLDKLIPAVTEVIQPPYEPSESDPSFGPPSVSQEEEAAQENEYSFDEDTLYSEPVTVPIPEDFDVTGLPLPGEITKHLVHSGKYLPRGFPTSFARKQGPRMPGVLSLQKTREKTGLPLEQPQEVLRKTQEAEAAMEAALPEVDEDPRLPPSRVSTAGDSGVYALPGEVLLPPGNPSLLDLHVFKEISSKKYEDVTFPERPKQKTFPSLGSSVQWSPLRLVTPGRTAKNKRGFVLEAVEQGLGKRRIAVRIILGVPKELEGPTKLLASLNVDLTHPSLGDYLGYDLIPVNVLESNGAIARVFKRTLHTGGATVALCIYSTFLHGGSVIKQLKQDYMFAPFWQREWACRRHLWKVLDALAFLHNQDQAHGAVLARNVLTNHDGTETVLGDCALAAMFRRSPDRLQHYGRDRFAAGDEDLVYAAPERLATNEDSFTHDSRSEDIWQLGLMALELLTGEPPLWERSVDDVVGLTTEIGVANGLPRMPQASVEAVSFVRACLVKDPYDRPTAPQLQRHHWFLDRPEWAVNMS